MSPSRHSLGVLIAILLIDLLAFTLILPLFPSIIDHFARQHQTQADPLFDVLSRAANWLQSVLGVPAMERHNNVFFGGLLGSLFSLLQFLSSPFFGALSDVHGRKALLLCAVLGSFLSYWLWSVSAHSFSLFFASRCIGGLSKASVSVAIAIVTDLVPSERRGHGMALVGASFSLAFLLGPSVGAYFSLQSRASGALFNAAPAHLAMALTALELVLVLAYLPETLPKMSPQPNDNKSTALPLRALLSPRALFSFDFLSPNRSVGRSSSIRLLRAYSRVYFLFLVLFAGLEFTLGFLTHLRFAYDQRQQGRLYLFSGVCMLCIQGALVRRVPSTFRAQRAGALVGLASIVPAFGVIAVAHTQLTLFAGLFLYSIASSTVVPFLTTLFSHQCDPEQKGVCLGAFRSIGALARAIGPLLGSLLFWLLGPTTAYAVGAIGLCAPLLLLWRIKSDGQAEKAE